MTNEEKYLREQMGSKIPFRVPEGYFEQLTEKVMQRLPEEAVPATQTEEAVPAAQTVQMVSTNQTTRPTLLRRLRPLLYAAACLVVAIVGFTLFFNKTIEEQQPQQVALATEQQEVIQASDEYIEEEVDYAMLDNQDIYYLLAEM